MSSEPSTFTVDTHAARERPAAGRPTGWAAGLRAIAEHPATGVALTFLIATAAIVALVGPSVFLHPAKSAVGLNPGSDYQVMTWSLEWWPWAIGHGVGPLHTDLLWAPLGFPTLWMTTIPFQSLIGLPLTLTAGSLVAYNFLILMAAPLAAASAYLLCREITGRFWPSIVGGLLFGLSPYMLGHTFSQHLNLTYVFPVPLLCLLAIRYARGRTSTRRFVLGFAAVLLVQVGCSLELFVDLTVFIAIGVAIALIGAGARRAVVWKTARGIVFSYLICVPVVGAIAAIALSAPHAHLEWAPDTYAIDLLNVVVPTQVLATGTGDTASNISQHFLGNPGEQTGYIGIPLLIVVVLAIVTEWRRWAWLAAGILVAGVLLSLGPFMTVGGHTVADLPFALANMPFLHYALPARLSLFAALAAAVLCAMWLARPGWTLLRVGVAGVVLASLFPNISPDTLFVGRWGGPVGPFGSPVYYGWNSHDLGRGFADAPGWKQVIKPGTNVLVLPTQFGTASAYWQSSSDMRFKLAVPGTPFAPPKIMSSPITLALQNNYLPSSAGPELGAARLRAYLLENHVGAVAVTGAAYLNWSGMVSKATAGTPITLGRTMVYRVRPGLHAYKAGADEIEARAKPTMAIRAGLWFDGRRSRVRVRLQMGHGGFGKRVTLSSPTGDADNLVPTIDGRGHAAVLWGEWRGQKVLMRAATLRRGRWHVATLESDKEQVAVPRVVAAPDGTIAAAWVASELPWSVVRAATLPPGGTWQKPVTLEKGGGQRGLTLSRTGVGGGAVLAWKDVAGTESRVRVAMSDGRRWSGVENVAGTLERLPDVEIDDKAKWLRWKVWRPSKRLEYWKARRVGTTWVPQPRPYHVVRHYQPAILH